ncbi:MAG TPA: ribonuclease HII [Eubacteriales bacterium]|nr:ribonuclease HII [Eubacteriales bacterium]
MIEFEYEMFKYKRLAGVDEVGRGPLAGPVVCACVSLPLDDLIEGVRDSKKLTALQRERLYEKIMAKAIDCKIAMRDHNIIDEINILNATKEAMTECINAVTAELDYVLIDAVPIKNAKFPTRSFIKGDDLSYLIGAASIVAKVTRDRIMCEYDHTYSGYGFGQNKGYGTKQHIEAIKSLGLTPIHRRTFVKKIIEL